MNTRLTFLSLPVRFVSVLVFTSLAFTLLVPALFARAATAAYSPSATSRLVVQPVGLSLSSAPSLVDVGEAEEFALHARTWGRKVTATLSFVAPHHGFTGVMRWDGGCNCFRIAVALAKRIHPIERAHATATVRFEAGVVRVGAGFSIRGLAANGRDYAPGGSPALTGWVSDPSPSQKQYQHYCAWVKTADGLGVGGYRVTFVVHFAKKSQRLRAGVTGSSGILCVSHSIGTEKAGQKVTVDVYANSLHTHTSFTPRP